MLRGLTTVSFWADDLQAAKQWYTELLGVEPYFQRPDTEHPAYIEFRLGDYAHELGIISRAYAPKGASAGPGGAITYWHVDDVAVALEKVLALGAKVYEPLTKRGEAGFITASVVDPFGNILGLMYNCSSHPQAPINQASAARGNVSAGACTGQGAGLCGLV